ncbi:MAG TPA: hypothetical protein VI112_16925 [Bacteroidia bacterium]
MSNKASDSLHKLIRSLTASEKRAFKLFASRHTLAEQNQYVKLFDAIDGQETYHEPALLKRFGTKQFSIVKGRLYDSILRSLDAFHSNSSIDAQLKRDLHCAEILYKKSLYDQCSKLLVSAKKIARKYERHSSLLEIYMWEKKLIEKDNYSGMTEEDINRFLTEDKVIGEKVKNFNDYWNIKSRLFMILNKRGKVRNPEELENFKKIIDNTLLQTEASALSIETKYLYHHIYSAYYFGVGDYRNCYEYLRRNVELVEGNLHIFEEEPNIYFSVLTNIIYVCSQLKDYEHVFLFLKKLREVPQKFEISKNEDLEIKLFSSAYSIEMTIYNNLGEYEKALELVPKIEEGLEKYAGNLNKVREAYFCTSIANAYFGAEKFSNALRWNNRILHNKAIDEIEDAHCFAEIMNVVIHLELKNDDIIPYTMKAAQRYLKAKKRVYKFETVFFDFISNLLREKDPSKTNLAYKELYDELIKLKDDPFEHTAFEYFDFISWAESKMKKIPFREIVEEKAKVRK